MPNALVQPLTRAVLLLGLLAACSSTDQSQDPVASQLGLTTAPPAASASGALLQPQPVVRVEDGTGAPVAARGRLITVRASPAGPLLGGTTELRTDADGKVAFTDLSLSGPVGTVTLTFESTGLRSVTAAPLQLAAGAPAVMESAGGNFQTVVVGNEVPIPPVVLVKDGAGNPVAGVPVLFAIAAGGGIVEGGSKVTGPDGRASPTKWTTGSAPGLNTMSATSTALPGVTVGFTITATVGPPTHLEIVGGDGQTATVGGAVPIAPSVKLTDAQGNPVSNVAVTFAAAVGGGSVTGSNPLSNAQGVATVGTWALGLTPGPNTLVASRAGVPSVILSATAVGLTLSSIDGGGNHSCGLTAAGAALCWGRNASGELGIGTTVNADRPTPVMGSLVFGSITTGLIHSCGLVGGAAWCWGDNSLGQLGDGTTTLRTAPVQVSGGFTFIALDAGEQFTCGLVAGGAAYCWGRNNLGQLGDGTQTNRSAPTLVSGGLNFTAIDAGTLHACALQASGALYCWGSNVQGRLGDGTTVMRLVPTAVIGGLSFVSATAGDSFTCGVTTGNAGYCWGNGASGFLGTGTTTNQSSPTPMAGSLTLSSVHSAGFHTCALATDGKGYCWGFNGSGELGDGSVIARESPVLVQGGLTFSRLRVGGEHSCGLGPSGVAFCWGKNSLGNLGDGTNISRQKPVGVVSP